MKISNLPDKEFKLMVTKMLNNLRRSMEEYRKNINKEIENIRKYQIEVINELKNMLERFNSKTDETEA